MLKCFKLLASLLFITPVYADGLIITPSQVGVALPGQLPATQTNDTGCANCVGFFLSGSGSSTGLTSSNIASLMSISLAPGDWDIQGVVNYNITATTTIDVLQCFITSTQNGGSLSLDNGVSFVNPSNSAVSGQRIMQLATPVTRVSINTTTSYYINTFQIFGVSTLFGQGYIRARRVR